MGAIRCISTMLVLGATIGTAPALAQSGKAKSKGAAKEQASPAKASPASDAEIRILREYYAGKTRPKPLPPGIAKNLSRGKPLPPGIAKTRLPGDLLARLPSRPDHQWVVTGDLVVLLDPVGLVVDILREIF